MGRWDDFLILKIFIMGIYLSYQPKEQLFTIGEVARLLNLTGIGTQHLYGYLRDLNIISPGSRIPIYRYLELGYFKVVYGTKAHYSKKLHPTTKVTKSGLEWLESAIFPKIRELEEKYLREL